MKLLSLFRGRSEHRFAHLLAPHIPGLYRLAYRLTGQRADAEDLVQDVLERLYPRMAELEKIETLRPWLARTLYNRFVDVIRRRRGDAVAAADRDEETLLAVPDDTGGPEASAEQMLLQRRVARALTGLNEEQRSLIVLHDMEGYTLTELESVLDTPLGTLKSRLHRARASLRAQLAMEPFAGEMRVERREVNS